MIKIYDSFSQTVKSLVDNNQKQINIYLCGPTVYNYVHIGNVRGVIVMDVLQRLLIHKNYKVNYVHNITDIDDKIIDKALLLKTDETSIVDKYYQAYLDDLTTLNIIMPTSLPKVSSYITQIISFISNLIKEEYAYFNNGNVYFRVNKIKDYGSLAHKEIMTLVPNFRIKNSTNKVEVSDFVLWKTTTIGLNWDSPWGKGRPGWHTECTVFIAESFKGETISLHGGGIDLKFPHHENERAQFIASNNKELANVWWHNGHVKLDKQKMSKSLNNIILVKDFCKQYHPNLLRYLILNRDHHQPLDFNDKIIKHGLITMKKYENMLKQWTYFLFINDIINNNVYDQNYYDRVINNLANNIDTTNTITLLETMIKELNEAINKKDYSEKYQNIFFTFISILMILGFNFKFGNYSDEIKKKIKTWEILKQAKNFQEADKIRNELIEANII